ncbi:hypothetical protein RRX38_15300 [Pseudomonas sp. DTU_2021_1001937_2_SI_NGA_ILE_001]|uniref:hypothetical protein n=1 Tax=Pseudomonas sp. DTU_2021_1001937_2_SI_NGA_ILE_001 TaxID=3077589 RepID=UPI0025E9DBDF|nr:hypothetical protein [Pseudomonas sp. DTU_2021_1001937_2_SI_NGA_ILE_001]WNW12451.1 hypothetical protein RRX38_15300 [Pseudomonas sp. DTU_2021_1001937_2_SI_NGA_ILE_001]
MNQGLDFLTILRRHFPVFISAFLLALFALTLTLILLFELYPPALQDYPAYLMAANLGMALYLCIANFLVIRGRPWAVWLIVTALLVCMLVVLGHWGRRMPQAIYVLGLLLPLCSLLVINSQRYRAMLVAMVQVRGQRNELRKNKRGR